MWIPFLKEILLVVFVGWNLLEGFLHFSFASDLWSPYFSMSYADHAAVPVCEAIAGAALVVASAASAFVFSSSSEWRSNRRVYWETH